MKLLACALLLACGPMLSAAPHVTVRITDGYGRTVRVALGPVDLMAEVRVKPHEPHRYLETVWDYAPPDLRADPAILGNGHNLNYDDGLLQEPQIQNGAVGSEVRTLNGERERIRQDVKLAHLEGGTFLVTATVYTDESRKRVCGRASARVVVQ